MPTLNWIGKEAVVNHDKEVPFKLLKKFKTHSVGENSQNLIIKGDNLEGLKALMPYYIGKIKCIYIDPPYNTGNENWVYNDKVNSPKIKNWWNKLQEEGSEEFLEDQEFDKFAQRMEKRMNKISSVKKAETHEKAAQLALMFENAYTQKKMTKATDGLKFATWILALATGIFAWTTIMDSPNSGYYIANLQGIATLILLIIIGWIALNILWSIIKFIWQISKNILKIRS